MATDDETEEKFGVADQEYHGEFRYANKSPQELRRLLETETNPEEREALEWTLLVFQAKNWALDPNDSRATRAGEPYRGEPRETAMPDSIQDLVKDRKPVEHVMTPSVGRLIDEAMKDGSGLGMIKGASGVWEEP